MQYTKSMIDLIFQIRKATPAEIRPRVKLSSSNLLTTLTDIYRILDDDKLKLMIYELMIQAGPEWAERLQQNRQASPHQKSPKNSRHESRLPSHGGQSLAAERVKDSKSMPTQPESAEVRADDPGHATAEGKPFRDKVVIYRGRRMVIPA